MNKLYLRGLAGQYWYNFTEALVYGLTYKPVPDGLTYHKQIKYGSDKLQYINIFTQNDKSKKRPLLIYVHGGSWVSGITEMRNTYIAQWAEKGFNTAAISYSYAPQKIYPAQLKEVFSAIDFLYENAEKYCLDFDNVVLAGESAGGYFISHIASSVGNNEMLKENNIIFRHSEDIRIRALVSISGCYDLNRLSDKKKPQASFPDLKTMITSYLAMSYDNAVDFLRSDKGKYVSPSVNSSYPPSFLIWADKDVLRYESFDFAEELRQSNVPYKLYKADGIIGMHAWPIVTLFKKSRECFKKTFDFVEPLLDIRE